VSGALRGRYFDGRSAAATEVRVALDAEGRLHGAPPLFEPVPLADTRVDGRLGNVPRRITLPGGGVIETEDHATLERWLGRRRLRGGLLHYLENNLAIVLAAALALGLVAFSALQWGLPLGAAWLAERVPAPVVSKLGSGALESMDGWLLAPSQLAAERRRALAGTFEALVPAARGGLRFDLVFRDGRRIGANALALPDGTVVVTDQLVRLARSEAEIAAVLLHEIGHVVNRHSLRMLVMHSGLAVLMATITGDVSSAGSLLLALPAILLQSSWSRELEREADDYALAAMAAQGLDPGAFADMLLRLERCAGWTGETGGARSPPQCRDGEAATVDPAGAGEGGGEAGDTGTWLDYVATHPPTAERIERFRAAARERQGGEG